MFYIMASSVTSPAAGPTQTLPPAPPPSATSAVAVTVPAVGLHSSTGIDAVPRPYTSIFAPPQLTAWTLYSGPRPLQDQQPPLRVPALIPDPLQLFRAVTHKHVITDMLLCDITFPNGNDELIKGNREPFG